MANSRSSARMPIGYVRDRTAAYREKWNALHPNASAASDAAAESAGLSVGATDTTGLLSGGNSNGATEVEMAPVQQSRIMEAEHHISQQLAAARTDLQQLTRLQAAAQEDLFGNENDKSQKVEEKRAQLRERIRSIHSLITNLPQQADANTHSVAERIKRAKATALNEIASELNRQEIQDLQAKAHKVPGMDQGRMDAIFSELAAPTPAYTEQQMQQLSSMQHEYEQRDEAIADLIKEVTSIQEVMRDLSVLVVEQGSMIDRIDQNITAAAESVERGAEQIKRAHESSKSGAMATCIFVLLVAIAVMFIVLLIVKR